MRTASGLFLLAVLVCSCTSPYLCTKDANCVLMDKMGACRLSTVGAFCAFPESTCATGWQWDESADQTLANTCAACDVFKQDCPMPQSSSCYPTTDAAGTGCFARGTKPQGASCIAPQECAPRLSCFHGVCVSLCGGLTRVSCTSGKACVDLSSNTPATLLGACM